MRRVTSAEFFREAATALDRTLASFTTANFYSQIINAQQVRYAFDDQIENGSAVNCFLKAEVENTNTDNWQHFFPENMSAPAIDGSSLAINVDQNNQLGVGGVSIVYLGQYRQQQVAVKILCNKDDRGTIQSEISEKNYMRFINEVNILGRCDSENIVKCLGYGLAFNGRPIMLTPHYVLRDVHSMMSFLHQKGQSLSASHQFKILYGTAIAIQYLHAMKIVHCDIKRENILVDDYITPKLADFGGARTFDELASSEKKSGLNTPIFTPPEFYDRKVKHLTPAIDTYCFALTTWEILTGREAFDYVRTIQQILWVLTRGDRPIVDQNTPLSIRLLLKFCWHNSPDIRPTGKELPNCVARCERDIGKQIDTDKQFPEVNKPYDFWSRRILTKSKSFPNLHASLTL